MKRLCLLPLFLFATLTQAQEKLQFVDVDDLIVKAYEAAEDENYDTTISYLNKIPKNDSIACSVLSTKSYFHLQNKQYDKVIEIADQGIGSTCYEEEDVFHINKAAALISSEKYEEALTSIEASLKIFPYSTNLWYNKANALENLGRLDEAVTVYQHCITIDPFSQAAHLQLGNICYKQEKVAQAMMCFNMYILLSDDINTTFETLTSLNNVASSQNSNTADPSVKVSKDAPSFEEIDLILSQKVALNKKYDTGNKINVALVNQNHALFTWLEKYKGKEGFWAQKYVPFYQWVMKNDNFNMFTYYITQAVENESLKRIVKKNEKEATEFAVQAIEKWTDIISKNERTYFYKNSSVQAVGQKEGEVMTGPFEFYDEDGRFTVDATFDKKGERAGTWKWYHSNGTLKESLNYINGKKEGENLLFYDNGKKYIVANFKDDALDGEYRLYTEDGALSEKKYFKNGKIDGPYESYFAIGESLKEFDVTYKEGEVEGAVVEYHANGATYLETPFTKTKRNGIEKKYNSKNTLLAEIGYKENELEGVYKLYYANGNIKEEGASVGGYYNGLWKSYYINGTLENEFTYDNGKIQGIYKSYNPDGTLLYEYEYKRGEIIAYTFYDRKGKVINSERKKGGEFFYTSFTAEEIKTAEGLYDISGGKTGPWKFYSSENGTLESEGEYKENNAVNTYTSYYPNGQIKSVRQFEDDILQGYYVDYYVNGQMNNQTYYVDDKPHGEWLEYYKDGTLKNKYYYHKGDFYGDQIEYSVDGTVVGITKYDQGKIVSEKVFDNNQKHYQTVDYASPGGAYTLTYNYPNGKPYISLDYLNGKKHGTYTRYALDGKKVYTGNYVSNLRDGTWTWFYEDGSSEVVTNYHLNEQMGDNIYYNEDGSINYKRTYLFDEIHGVYNRYFEDGTLKSATNYTYGKIHGRKENYDESGKLQLVRFYDYDRLIGYSYMGTDGKEVPMIPLVKETGKVKAYYDNGKVSREFEYKNGDLEGTYKIYYYDGSLFNNITYAADLLHGTDIEYYKNGTVKQEQGYLFGDYHGLKKVFYEDGTLKEEIPYKLDKKHGVASYYSKDKKLQKKETYYNGTITYVEKF